MNKSLIGDISKDIIHQDKNTCVLTMANFLVHLCILNTVSIILSTCGELRTVRAGTDIGECLEHVWNVWMEVTPQPLASIYPKRE